MVCGSRMHVLNWIEEGSFARSMSDLIAVTGMTVRDEARRMPRGDLDRDEARLGKKCGGLVPDRLNSMLRDWWLVQPARANMPSWDLACDAVAADGRPGLILVEAKGHVQEFSRKVAAKAVGKVNPDNHHRARQAIEEARVALSSGCSNVGISTERWYQMSIHVAFAWKLATLGMPTTLVYLGFVGDDGLGRPIRDSTHWKAVLSTASDAVPDDMWETRIDCGAAPLWLLARTKSCLRTPRSPRMTSGAYDARRRHFAMLATRGAMQGKPPCMPRRT